MKRKKSKQPKRNEPAKKPNTNSKPSFQNKPPVEDDEITSESTYLSDSEEMKEEKQPERFGEQEGEGIKETHDEMKARIARAYLEKLDALHKFDEEESEEEDKLGAHLQKEFIFSKKSVSTFKARAAQVAAMELTGERIRFKKGHQLPVTCLAISFDGSHLYTGSKDCCVIQWDLPSLKIVRTFQGHRKLKTPGHKGHVCAVAVSSNEKFLASGATDHEIKIYDLETNTLVHTFTGHKDTVTGLTFRHGTNDLYSSSNDRTVKLWDCGSLGMVETLYGHELAATGIDSLYQEKCITSSEDGTVRLWKIGDGTNLVFRTERLKSDCISYVTEEKWVSGTQQGIVHLWSAIRKKPLFEVENAHGVNGLSPNWITAIAALKFSDLFATGSCSGHVKLWKINKDNTIECVKEIPVTGWINALQFSLDGKYLVVGVGQEPTHGRWSRIKEARNGVVLIHLGAAPSKPATITNDANLNTPVHTKSDFQF